MPTRRGSQYCIHSDACGLRGRNDPTKGKRKGKIPSGTESTQGSAISQKQLPEMPIISDLGLELSRSHSNREKSHSEGSDRHLHVSVQTVLHILQGKRLKNAATNPPSSDELLAHPQKAHKGGGNSEIIQWMESTIIQTSYQENKVFAQQNEVDCHDHGKEPPNWCLQQF
ncbi:hypothetical protein O181_003780 [Austropuccinia psidii MF-1]|uniref:Uncharacterized protein n=1 Tax=Austropuccinia psidii MF-1 TaxID=1389203 RepID=A0A9Q3GE87_9BASI|nr:hypothetical protein [Austropuccinia psidii MF-1]